MPYDIAGALQNPNIIGNALAAGRQGAIDGQAAQAQRKQNALASLTAQSYDTPADSRNTLLAKMATIDPQAADQQRARFATMDADQKAQLSAGLDQFARTAAGIAQDPDEQRAAAAYGQLVDHLASTGKDVTQFRNVPPKIGAKMALMQIASVKDLLGSAGIGDQKPMILSNGAQLVDSTGKVLADNPTEQHDTGELAMLRAMQQDPSLLETYRRAHPVASGGMGRAPSGYRFTQDGSLEAIPGGPADAAGAGQGLSGDAIDNAAWSFMGTGKLPPIGRGKEGVAQRTAIMNHAAKIAKEAGISPAELQTVPGRNRALQSSLTNLQKMSDVMEKSEMGFQNNMDLALAMSDKVSRSGMPLVNAWLLGGKAQMGDLDVAKLDAYITTAATDYARIMSGQTGAGGTPITTAEEAKKLIRKELSNKQFHAVADALYQDIQGQQAAVHAQRGKILGAMQALHDASAPVSTGSAAQSSPAARPRATNPQTGETVEFDGQQWVLVHG